jgi:hypothetical protein
MTIPDEYVEVDKIEDFEKWVGRLEETEWDFLVVEYFNLDCGEHSFSMPKGNRIYPIYVQFLKDRGVVI